MLNLKKKSFAHEEAVKLADQVTLIIPTYNRHYFLTRLLHYYANQKSLINFLILDSSSPSIQAENKKQIESSHGQMQYISYPSSIPVAEKLLNGLSLVKTPYCAFCADDDLVFISGLLQALYFLHHNPDYVCADGIYLNFNPIGHDINLIIEYASKGINAEDCGARVFKLCQKYESLFYGVFRTPQALQIFTGVNKNYSLHYQELFQAVSALLLGKSHRLPLFYAARQHCTPAEQNRDRWQTYYWFTDNAKEFMEHYLQYRQVLWDFYQKQHPEHQYSKEEFFKLIDVVHAMYFGLGCPPAYFHATLKTKWPNDVFTEWHHYHDDICTQLKNPWRIQLENYLHKMSVWLPKYVASLYSIRAKNKLDKKIKQQTNQPWKCMLGRDVRWLVSIDQFKESYSELCQYLSSQPLNQENKQ